MSRFGETTFDYVGFPVGMDAMSIKGESSNVATWSTEATEMVSLLFKGTEGSSSGTYAGWCKDEEGTINGVGPQCVNMKEQGEKDTALCYYEKTKDCIEEWREEVFESSRRFAKMLEYNLQLASAYVDSSPRSVIYITNVYSAMRKELDPEREAYDKAKEVFDACIEDITDECECKRCVWTITYAEPEEDTPEEDTPEDADTPPAVDPEEEEPTGFDPLSPEFDELSTSSGLEVIPRVWGRYVVGGNIIWTGNVRTVTASTTYDTVVTGRVTAQTFDTYADISIGLCAGTVSKLLRLWFNEVLVLNNIVDVDDLRNAATDYDVSALAPDSYDLTGLVNNRAVVTLYTGSESQGVNASVAQIVGFGRVPAYRGLSYVHLSNMNISSLEGSFPEVRAEVATLVEDDPLIVESSGPDVFESSRLIIEPRTGQVFVNTTDSVCTLDWDTLDKQWETPFDPSADFLIGLESGFHMAVRPYLGAFQKYVVFDQSFTERRTVLGDLVYGGEFLDERFVRTMLWYNPETAKYYDLVTYTDEDQGVAFGIYDYSAESFESVPYVFDVYPGTFQVAPGTLRAVNLVSVPAGVYYDHYYLDSSVQTQLVIGRHQVTDSEGAIQLSMSSTHYTETTIPGATLWGDETASVDVLQAMVSAADNSILILFNAAGRKVLTKLDASSLAVIWRTELPSDTPQWVYTGSNGMLRYAFQRLILLTNGGDIVDLSLLDGTWTVLGTLSGGFPLYATDGGQCYDGRTNSVTYITTTGTVARVFLEKFSPLRVSLADIIDDISEMSHLRGFLDASAVESITLGGYSTSGAISLRTFMESVAEFYNVGITDDGTRLRVVDKGSIATVITIDRDRDIIAETTKSSFLSPATLPDTVSVQFVTVDYTGMFQSIQEVTTRGDIETYTPVVLTYSLDVNDDPATMRARAERILYAARGMSEKIGVSLMPKLLALTSQDAVLIEDETFRVDATLLSDTNATGVTAVNFATVDNETSAAMVSVEMSTGVNQTTVGTSTLTRPVVLFTNALSNEDALRSGSGRQIVYTAVEASTADIEALRVKLRVKEHTAYVPDTFGGVSTETFVVKGSDLYSSALHRKAAHFGFLVSAPLTYADRPLPYTSNAADELTVKFAREDTVTFIASLTNYAPPAYGVLESETENILIVDQEYIKFGSYEIMDSLTVRFYNLFRGWRGTEPYMSHTAAFVVEDEVTFDYSGEEGGSHSVASNGAPGRVYLYTSDTIFPMSVVPSKTKRRASARVFTGGAAPAGYRRLEFTATADAGSSRPWAVTDAEVFAVDGDQNSLVIRVKRRHPLMFDGTSVGPITDLWESRLYLCDTVSDSADPLDFGSDNTYVGVDATLVHESPGEYAIIDTFIIDMTGRDSQKILIAHVSKDEEGGRIYGHPALFTVEVGDYPTYAP